MMRDDGSSGLGNVGPHYMYTPPELHQSLIAVLLEISSAVLLESQPSTPHVVGICTGRWNEVITPPIGCAFGVYR